jgi:putative lysine transport system substrate-binding protein
MKKFASVLLILMLVMSLFLFAACGTTDDNGGGNGESNEFRVGMECNYAPFNWTQTDDSNGAVPIQGGGYAGGYDVEIAKLIAEGLGKELVIVKTEWDGLTPALTSGKIDAIIAGMSPTAERKETIDFSDNYYNSELVVVVKKDSELANAKTLNDFAGAKVTAQLNTFHYTVIEQMEGVEQQAAMETFPAMIVALSSGKIDGYISERPGAVSAVASNPELTFIEFEEGKGFIASEEDTAIAVGLVKGTDATQINEILNGITKEQREELMNTAVKNQPLNVDDAEE